jgi:hypothetical protein
MELITGPYDDHDIFLYDGEGNMITGVISADLNKGIVTVYQKDDRGRYLVDHKGHLMRYTYAPRGGITLKTRHAAT